jgi:hypothetical protein
MNRKYNHSGRNIYRALPIRLILNLYLPLTSQTPMIIMSAYMAFSTVILSRPSKTAMNDASSG